MSVSIVSLVTDAVRDGHPVIGFGFNSNGRYAPSCLLRERFFSRLLDAASEDLLDETVSNFDPAKIWACAPTRRPIQRFGRIRSVPILRGLHNQH
jgi:hypothetical protein